MLHAWKGTGPAQLVCTVYCSTTARALRETTTVKPDEHCKAAAKISLPQRHRHRNIAA
jgi:hypothetical protein